MWTSDDHSRSSGNLFADTDCRMLRSQLMLLATDATHAHAQRALNKNYRHAASKLKMGATKININKMKMSEKRKKLQTSQS